MGTFGGASALPVLVAAELGMFRRAGLDVRTSMTRSSGQLRDGLQRGELGIVHLAPDNVIAWADDEGLPVRAWLAGSAGPISLVARATERMADLRGAIIGVDAPTSGFAPILRQLLATAGLDETDVDLLPLGATRHRFAALEDGSVRASMLTLPWSLLARRFDARVLADHTVVAPRLLTSCAASLATWLDGQPSTASAYAEAIDGAVDWLRDHRHRDAASAMLADDMDLDASVAAEVLDAMLDDRGGWPRRSRLEGGELEATWQLRSGTLGRPELEPDFYIARIRAREAGP